MNIFTNYTLMYSETNLGFPFLTFIIHNKYSAMEMDILEGAIKHRNIHGLEIGIIFVNKQNVSKQKETFVNDVVVLKIGSIRVIIN